jgi:hypothetical protein
MPFKVQKFKVQSLENHIACLAGGISPSPGGKGLGEGKTVQI